LQLFPLLLSLAHLFIPSCLRYSAMPGCSIFVRFIPINKNGAHPIQRVRAKVVDGD